MVSSCRSRVSRCKRREGRSPASEHARGCSGVTTSGLLPSSPLPQEGGHELDSYLWPVRWKLRCKTASQPKRASSDGPHPDRGYDSPLVCVAPHRQPGAWCPSIGCQQQQQLYSWGTHSFFLQKTGLGWAGPMLPPPGCYKVGAGAVLPVAARRGY